MDALQAEIERQDRELERLETIAKKSDPDVRFEIGAELDERIGALLEQINVRPATAPVCGIRA